MARKTQLLDLIAQLRAETNRSQSVAVGIDELDNLKTILRRTQETLYDDYEWPHLNVERTVTLAAGQRYYDFPSDLNFDGIRSVKLQYNEVYQPIDKYISLEDYSIFDSNNNERSSPALKWDMRHTGTEEQIEVWPIPNDNIQTLYIRGKKALGDLIQESDVAELDDRLIVLHAAGEMLAAQGSKHASVILKRADARLHTLRRNSSQASVITRLGSNPSYTDRNKVKIVVA